MDLPEFLSTTRTGAIRLTGHRIDLYHLVRLYDEGLTAEMLHQEYPSLSLALIHKVIAFSLENRPDVDAYVARCEAEIERQRAAAPPAPTIEELKARRKALDPTPTP